jgi:protein LTV1
LALGSGFLALVGTKMTPLKDLDKTAPVRDIWPIADVLGEASDVMGSGKATPPAEEVLIDRQSYFLEKMRNPWDSESVLTTVPTLSWTIIKLPLVHLEVKDDKKKEGDSFWWIDRSRRQVGPANCLVLKDWVTREQEGGADTYISVSKGQARQKTETADEKKLRKINVKKEREMDDGCDDGWRDSIKDGSPLGFELGFVKGSDNSWRYSIKTASII